MMSPTDEARYYKREGLSPVDALRSLCAAGVEYPDGVFAVTQAYRLDDEGVEELEDKYDNQI